MCIRDRDEFVRILKPGGYILRVEPGEHHLYELKEIVYDHVYLNQSSPILDERFSLVREWKTCLLYTSTVYGSSACDL